MIWWPAVIAYLVVGVAISRVVASRTHISTTDATALILTWPLFLVALVIKAVVDIVGRLGGGEP